MLFVTDVVPRIEQSKVSTDGPSESEHYESVIGNTVRISFALTKIVCLDSKTTYYLREIRMHDVNFIHMIHSLYFCAACLEVQRLYQRVWIRTLEL